MQVTSSAAPTSAAPPLDAVLLGLARAPVTRFADTAREALAAAARALGAREAALWMLSPDGQALVCHGRAPADGDESAIGGTVDAAAVWPGPSALAAARWSVAVLPGAEGGELALDAGVWSQGALAGFVRVRRDDARSWTEAEGAFAAALADRLAAAWECEARARAENDLDCRNRHVDDLEAIAQLGSWDQDLATDEIVWSAQQCRLHGVDPVDAPRTVDGFMSFVHPDDRQRVADACAEVIREGTPLGIRYRIVRPDGKPFLTYQEVARGEEQARQTAERVQHALEDQRQVAELARQTAEQARQEAERERRRADETARELERLRQQLRSLGHDPE